MIFHEKRYFLKGFPHLPTFTVQEWKDKKTEIIVSRKKIVLAEVTRQKRMLVDIKMSLWEHVSSLTYLSNYLK